MKITNIEISNVLGARDVNLNLTHPVNLFAGCNGAGKSSIQEAVRMALTGATVRVDLKKDYVQLLTLGCEAGFAEVEIDSGARAYVTLPDGKTGIDSSAGLFLAPKALPYVLDAQLFASLTANDRRTFLFGLMGLSAGEADVQKRLLAKGCDAHHIEAIAPMLRSGFEVTHKEAQAKARDFKAAWRTLTGETYGDKKGAAYQAPKPQVVTGHSAELQTKLEATDASLATANQRLGSLLANKSTHDGVAKRLLDLREKSSRHARIVEKLQRDEVELTQWTAKVDAAREKAAGSQRRVGLVHELANSVNALVGESQPLGIDRLTYKTALSSLAAYESQHGAIPGAMTIADPEAVARLPEFEKALLLTQSAVNNDRRDLAESSAAAGAIAEFELGCTVAPDESEMIAAKKHLDDLKTERTTCAAQLAAHQDATRQANQAADKTAKALTAHQSVAAWTAIADALAPDGIPGDMLMEALGPINARLATSSNDAEWPRIEILPDMRIQEALHERGYDLLSESEKWRADAMLAEAISHISKVKLLILDRLDVLDLPGRSDLIAWLDILAQDGEIDTALIFGTLKALPANLPTTVQAHWIENGVVGKLKVAA